MLKLTPPYHRPHTGHMNTTPNLRRSLTIALTKGLVLFACIALWAGMANLSGAFDANISGGTSEDVMAIRPHAEGSPAAVADRHGCWAGRAPADMAGKVPGHVVITDATGAIRYAGRAAVDQALGQVFAGEDHGIHVHAFCR